MDSWGFGSGGLGVFRIGYLHMTGHGHITGVTTLAIFGNPGMLGKQSGKRPFQPDSDLLKQLRSTT